MLCTGESIQDGFLPQFFPIGRLLSATFSQSSIHWSNRSRFGDRATLGGPLWAPAVIEVSRGGREAREIRPTAQPSPRAVSPNFVTSSGRFAQPTPRFSLAHNGADWWMSTEMPLFTHDMTSKHRSHRRRRPRPLRRDSHSHISRVGC